ncbi:histone acetyltransferase subunit NuA4-domain-containing protein [Syncephalastrum racemosum]|uniref:Chromatin modification-related protein EAF6 n=1 Tax=Syncephalastrum racemosum TaxID=13706 RepID=A0A1X2H8L4_SYNRA|nr:histone acetyltransferase subunit NuA4-domain-containing protein [Syncephalastrum racemosum]
MAGSDAKTSEITQSTAGGSSTPASASQTPTAADPPVTSTAPSEPPQVTRQKYEEAKIELQALLSRKKQVDTNLINLENAIYLFEGSYLEDTQQNGNIIRGFGGYLTNRSEKKRIKFTELDRLFSLSSSTYQKALAQKEDRDQESSQDDRSTQSSGSLTMRKDKKRKLKLVGADGNMRRKKHMGDDEDNFV